MYEIGDIVDIETTDFFGTVEIMNKNEDGTYETIFYPEEKTIVISESDIVGYACDFSKNLTRGETTKFLSNLSEYLINPTKDPRIYWAKEVTFDYSTAHAIRVDYMKFKPVNNTVSGIEKGDFYCYEVKSSV